MTSELEKQLEQLEANGTHVFLNGALHGIEKEGLRVDPRGRLSQTPHPEGLGSSLTNTTITTDFSESLLELITPVFRDSESAVTFLAELHGFTYHHLGQELIWAGSMPCEIEDPGMIPIARYGTSNIGKLKYFYRVGLSHRYGRIMQSIAGIHYNFSLSDDFWRALQADRKNSDTLQEFRSASYFRMIRNFRRHSWLLLFLFGATPALDDSFLQDRPHELQRLHDRTLYLPHATSLRMSDIGYSTKVQADLSICFNHLATYIESLCRAIRTPYPAYEQIGVKVDGSYRQLNDTILQIENEHYSDVRPKRVARGGERPLQALKKHGVEYIEIRNIDVNPFLPVGIDVEQTRFLETFLISCLLMDERVICPSECKMAEGNVRSVILEGRRPGLQLVTRDGEASLLETGREMLDQMDLTGGLLDRLHETRSYRASVDAQRQKLEDPSLTPSAKLLRNLQETGMNYSEWIMQKSRELKKELSVLPSAGGRFETLQKEAAASKERQRQWEADDRLSFDQYLEKYLADSGDFCLGEEAANQARAK